MQTVPWELPWYAILGLLVGSVILIGITINMGVQYILGTVEVENQPDEPEGSARLITESVTSVFLIQ